MALGLEEPWSWPGGWKAAAHTHLYCFGVEELLNLESRNSLIRNVSKYLKSRVYYKQQTSKGKGEEKKTTLKIYHKTRQSR